jgi:hypothetical protein
VDISHTSIDTDNKLKYEYIDIFCVFKTYLQLKRGIYVYCGRMFYVCSVLHFIWIWQYFNITLIIWGAQNIAYFSEWFGTLTWITQNRCDLLQQWAFVTSVTPKSISVKSILVKWSCHKYQCLTIKQRFKRIQTPPAASWSTSSAKVGTYGKTRFDGVKCVKEGQFKLIS